jgi:hypothetical protein
MKYVSCVLALVAVWCLGGCTTTAVAKDYNGLLVPGGTPIAHVNTTNVAVHVLFTEPVWGDATIPQVVKDCTAAAKAEGAKHIRLVQSTQTVYWWILPPISFVIAPVVGNTAGDAY